MLSSCLNFRQAAQKLFISQSALSRHMEILEGDLGTRLFKRTTQVVELTETGRLLQLRAQGLVEDYEDIKLQIHDIELRTSRSLRIGVPYYAIEDYLGTIPTEFEKKYPEVNTSYFVETPSDVYYNLVNHKTDLAFLVNYKMSSDDFISYVPVYREPLGVVLNVNNPLAEKPYLRFRELKKETFLLLTDPFFVSSMTQIGELSKSLGEFNIERFINYDRMESLLIGISKNDGICISGALLKSQESRFIAYRPLVDKGCWRMVCLCFDKKTKNPLVQNFIDLYRSSSYYRI